MEIVLESLAGQGVLGTFLVLVIVYFKREIKELRDAAKLRNEAHIVQINAKDAEIKRLNDASRDDATDTIGFIKDFGNDFKNFTEVIKQKI